MKFERLLSLESGASDTSNTVVLLFQRAGEGSGYRLIDREIYRQIDR